jgi:carbon storage regulator CsrA
MAWTLTLAPSAIGADSAFTRKESRMLVLKRRPGESVAIGQDIEVKVLQIVRDGVRIGITAPDEVLILRSELLRNERETDETDGFRY